MLSFCVSLAYADLMRRRLPNLNAVKAFDAAARHQSFTRAAEELSVTHAAISRQVRALEQELGTALFERRHRQVALTVDGRRYAEIVADALLLLGLGPNDQVAQHAAERVVLEVDSDLATLWLMPQLDEAALATLGVELDVRSHPEPPRTLAPDVDLALTWGAMDVPGFGRERYLTFNVFPVCAPSLAKRVRAVGPTGVRLLHDRGRVWWDEVTQRSGASLDAAPGHLTFHRTGLCMDAAARGLGVAIGDEVCSANMLADGRLVRPCGPDLPGRMAFHLLATNRGPLSPGVQAVRDWLRELATAHRDWVDHWRAGLPG